MVILWRERTQRVGTLPQLERPRPVPVRWCQCGGKGTCLGCLILTLIQTHYGTSGVMFLLDAIKAAGQGETA